MAETIIFAKTRHVYESYKDFYKLVELADFAWQYVDLIPWYNENVTVIGATPNEEWELIPTDRKAKFAHWSLERGVSKDASDMAYPAKHLKADALWASDRAYAAAIGAQYVFMGGHQAFGHVNARAAPRYDFVTLAYHNQRRIPIVDDLQGQGLRWADVYGGAWGDERTRRLNESALCINIHQDEQLWHEPIRFVIMACHAVPILSEPCADAGYFTPGTHYLEAATGDLGIPARLLLNDPLACARLAAQAWRLVNSERPFRECVLAAVSGLTVRRIS